MSVSSNRQAIIDDLLAARSDRRPIAPIRDRLPAHDLAAAYEVQAGLIERALIDGARRVGRKIGVTSAPAQDHMGVDEPNFGVLLDVMQRLSDSRLTLHQYIAPRLEGEIAFRIGRDLIAPPADPEALAACIYAVASAFEVVDSAIAGWEVDIVDATADNGCAAGFILGPWQPPPARLDHLSTRMTLLHVDVVATTGGTAADGGPLAALGWLAKRAADMGQPLLEGEVVLTGALAPMVPLVPGLWTLTIEGFEPLRVEAGFGQTPAVGDMK